MERGSKGNTKRGYSIKRIKLFLEGKLFGMPERGVQEKENRNTVNGTY